MGICFLRGENYREFLRRRAPNGIRPGEIVDRNGKRIGTHDGCAFYTVGQKRGLGLPPSLAVVAIDAAPIPTHSESAAMNIEYDFGLKAEDVAAYKGVKSNDNGDAGLVLVVEAASGKAQDVVTALESYKQDQVAFYGNYAEFAQAQSNVENAIISSKGDRVVMVIASNECTADLNSAVDSALNS